MRRRPGVLLPLEEAILSVVSRHHRGSGGIHGFALAKKLSDDRGRSKLVGHGTLYKALGRLEKTGLLESWWEDAEAAADAGRPRRRLYAVTAAGSAALARADTAASPAEAAKPRTAHA